MSIRLCFTLLLAHSAFCDSNSKTIDDSILQNVFGSPQLQQNLVPFGRPASPSSNVAPGRRAPNSAFSFAQAVPVTEQPVEIIENVTTMLEEPKFIQSPYNYDQFDWVLTKRVAASSNQNFLLSPLGMKLALAILTEAATGPTRDELSAVLGNDLNVNVTRDKYFNIMKSLNEPASEYILNMGSRICFENGVSPQQQFAAIAQHFYRTELVNVDFKNPKVAATEINAWVANVTAGRISALVDDDDVDGIVAMILTTLYYKGNWTHQFPPTASKLGNFYVSPDHSKQVVMMNTRDKFYYAESAAYDAKILRLPYLGNKFSMYIVVPNSLSGLPRVMSTLSVRNIRTEVEFMKEHLVDVTLPKFRFDYTSVLDPVLQEMGIRRAFQDTASFPKMARGGGLPHHMKVSRVLQRSGVDVNEVGSTAYAATEITLVNKFGDDEETYEEVLANRPFLFFIQDEFTRQLLFTGRVCDPGLVDGAFKLS